MQVAGRAEPRILRGLHRHRGALAERAVEQEPPVPRQRAQHPAGRDVGAQVGVGGGAASYAGNWVMTE